MTTPADLPHRRGVLAIWSPVDGVLGAVAPIALAAAAGTALVVDLDPAGPRYPGTTSLASLVAEGPRRSDLAPGKRGVAVLRNGGVTADAAGDVVAALMRGWPWVVLRHPPGGRPSGPGIVPVLPLVPGGLFPALSAAVYQTGPWPMRGPAGSILLPRPRAATIQALLEGRRPVMSRWVRAWCQVWERQWE